MFSIVIIGILAAAQPVADVATATPPSREPAAPAEPAPAVAALPPADSAPPFIEDFAVAAANPKMAPMVTAIVIDDESAVLDVTLYYRRTGETAFQTLALSPGDKGLFVGRLPDGVQNTGFAYYLRARDTAKNPTSLGSEKAPIFVGPAVEGTLERLKRQWVKPAGPAVHPAWIMMSLGTSIIAGAGAGAFAIDYTTVGGQIVALKKNLEDGIGEPARLRNDIAQRESAQSGDLIFGGVLAVVAAVALTTGVGLMIASGLE